MKSKKGHNWFAFLFNNSGYQFPGMIWSVLTIGTFTAILVALNEHFHLLHFAIPGFFLTVLGLVTGLLLVFRTNTAYDRWWEGRKQIGQLLNSSRDLAIKVHAYLPEEAKKERILMANLLHSFAWALKMHLREGDFSASKEFIPEHLQAGFEKAQHKPNFLLTHIALQLKWYYEAKYIEVQQLIILDSDITVFTNVMGACERIKNTPMPMGYGLHLKRILLIYLITLPVTVLQDLHWWTVPIVMVIFYTMVGIELIGEEIEEPFGEDPNDLPFDSVQNRIGLNVKEILM